MKWSEGFAGVCVDFNLRAGACILRALHFIVAFSCHVLGVENSTLPYQFHKMLLLYCLLRAYSFAVPCRCNHLTRPRWRDIDVWRCDKRIERQGSACWLGCLALTGSLQQGSWVPCVKWRLPRQRDCSEGPKHCKGKNPSSAQSLEGNRISTSLICAPRYFQVASQGDFSVVSPSSHHFRGSGLCATH